MGESSKFLQIQTDLTRLSIEHLPPACIWCASMRESLEGSGMSGTLITHGVGEGARGPLECLENSCVHAISDMCHGWKEATTTFGECCLCEGIKGAPWGCGGPAPCPMAGPTAPGSHWRCSDSIRTSEWMSNRRAAPRSDSGGLGCPDSVPNGLCTL